ncbi:hypothetical protein ABN028_20120 [Actinopolymorpha sp. B17G11]|uniref:hypothetical protein n=1 Tax=Actinopolymorpha sp. B17G11 TaxID=3160861 RepID=UPI0032E3FA32
MPFHVVATKAGVPPQFQSGGGNAPAAAPPEPDLEEEPLEEEEDQGREWAGDPFVDGEPSDPAEAFASFTSPEGDEAWLDKAEDGTLTGWVRNAEGEVWRYTDADAWAVDVDDAGMTRSAGGEEEPEEDVDEEEADVDEEEPIEDEDENPFASTEGKHLQGQHNQQTHGNRHGARSAGRLLIRTARSADVGSRSRSLPRGRSSGGGGRRPGGGGGSSPSDLPKPGGSRRGSRAPRSSTTRRRTSRRPTERPEPADTPSPAAPKPEPATPKPQAEETPDRRHIAHLLSDEREKVTHADLRGLDLTQASDEDLDGLIGKSLDDPDATQMLAEEMDSRDHGKQTSIADGSPAPDSAAGHYKEGQEFDSVLNWFQSRQQTPYEQAREAYQQWIDSMLLRAEDATNGYLLKRKYLDRYSTADLFNGTIRQRDLPRIASEELLRWFAEPGNRWMNFEQFAAETLGWSRERLRRAAAGRAADLSEFG